MSQYRTIVHTDKEPFKPYWNEEITDEQYHADKTFVGSTSLRKMVKSPAAFHSAFFGGLADKETDSMRLGTIIHMAMLQGSKFKERYVVMPEFTGLTQKGEVSSRSKEALDKKAKWIAELPPETAVVTQEEYNDIVGVVESVLSHPRASALLKNGKPEIAGFYVDPETGIRCKIKPDFLPFIVDAFIDVKTTTDCSWSSFRKSVENYRYDIQIAQYRHGIEMITGKKPEHSAWIAVERKAPYEVRVHEVGPIYEMTGHYEYRNALKNIRKHCELEKWPQGVLDVEIAEPSIWFQREYEQREGFDGLFSLG